MSKRKEMIKLLDSISDFKTYSKYSCLLRIIFKNNCLEDLLSSLKNPKHIDVYDIFKNDVITEKKKGLVPINKEPTPKKGKKELDLLHDTGEDIEEEKNKNEKITKYRGFNSMVNLRNLNKENVGLNPFKYEPNYNSIYKNVHSFKIVLHTSKAKNIKTPKIKNRNLNIKILNSDFNNDSSFNKKNQNKYKTLYSESSKFNSEKGQKNYNYQLFKTLSEISLQAKKSKKRLKNIKFNFNHTRRFSKYTSRKANIYNMNKQLTYIEPNKYPSSKKDYKSIDFKKMVKRNSKDLLNKQLLFNPASSYYSPKYDLIEQKPINVLFNKNDSIDNKKRKKFKLRKILSSYNVVKDYLMIDNDKLKRKINLNIGV